MTPLVYSPEELLDRLFAIFPDFRVSYQGPLYEQPLNYDSVLTAFTSDFGVQFRSSTDNQFRDFATLVLNAVAAGGQIEYAFSTCFLQHLREVDINRAFYPYLWSAAREHIKP
jgi:hypothetical protein